MQERLLKKIVLDCGGPGSEKIVEILYNKQNVNEFIIAKKLDMTINKTRNILYKLADSGLVSFIRKKDKKKGGWYTYFWTLDIKKSLIKYLEKIEHDMIELENKLENLRKERNFYCTNCNLDYNEENAMMNDFTCPECGETLNIKPSEKAMAEINLEIKKAEEIKKEIESEVSEIERKEQKKKEIKMRKEQKTKLLEREKKRKERRKLKEKEKKGRERKSRKRKKNVRKSSKRQIKKK